MKGSGSWVAINSQAIGVVSVSKKAGTEETLGLCWWQSHCSRAEKGKPSLRQSLCLNYIYSGLVHSVFPWDINQPFGSLPAIRHKRITSEQEQSMLEPYYGLFRYW